MSNLIGQRILLGVTGGIAAYKAANLVRLLKTAGAEVQVVMTQAAQAFITPLTLQTLSGHSVRCELFDTQAESGLNHIELARWAERIVIAPATANFIARLAHGFADDLLSTLCLATESPIILAPAMNYHMWQHPATQDNLQLLRNRGVTILGPTAGVQACGDVGVGRMLEPETIVAALKATARQLSGIKVLLTAGPTREALDPVRYLSNRSSGRMGYALAQALHELGAEVCLISGPVTLNPPPNMQRIMVESALEMYHAVQERVADCQIFVATAAVADYRIASPSLEKIKKNTEVINLQLVRNPDILAEVAARSSPPFTVGFAAETHDLASQAREKMQRKKLHMLAANLVGNGQGFEALDNALLVFWSDGQIELTKQPKTILAQQLALLIAKCYHSHSYSHSNST